MRRQGSPIPLLALILAAPSVLVGPPVMAQPPVIDGCPVFPADNIWNVPVDGLPVHPSSAAYIATCPTSLARRR